MKKHFVVLSLIIVASCAKRETPQVAATANGPIEAQTLPAEVAPPVVAAPAPAPRPSKFKPVATKAAGTEGVKTVATNSAPAASAPVPVPVPVPVMNSAPAPAPVPQQAAPVAASRPAPPPPPPPMQVTLKEGSVIAVRLGETLNSEKNQVGDSFSATLSEPIVIDGLVIAERGARVSGKVVDADRAGRVKGVAALQLALTEVTTADNQRVPIVTDAFLKKGPDTTKSDVAKVGIAAGIGAAIGAIAGGGKGAAIGAGAGGAAGTGGVLATRGKPAILPAETLVRFRVTQAVTITEKQ